jgi:hypothetical protein
MVKSVFIFFICFYLYLSNLKIESATELEPINSKILAKGESTEDILYRHCKNTLNNLNVLVKVLDNLVGTLTIRQQQRRRRQEQEEEEEKAEGEKEVTKPFKIYFIHSFYFVI